MGCKYCSSNINIKQQVPLLVKFQTVLNLRTCSSIVATIMDVAMAPDPLHLTSPVNGEWTGWGGWSECSVPCGTGSQRRARTCTAPEPAQGGATCEGPGHETRTCQLRAVCVRRASWGPWGEWGPCSESCGGGTQSRARACSPGGCQSEEVQARDCNTWDCARRRKKLRSAIITVWNEQQLQVL